jgi:hypothetical protein
MWFKWKLVLVSFDIVLISTQNRCTVCAEHAIGSEIIFDAPDELLGDMGQVEGHFGLLRDGVNLGEIGARFALNVPWARKLFSAYPMELLANLGQMEACFGPFGDCVNLDI